MENRFKDFGLLVLRVGLGGMFILHGYPKITGGMEAWTGLGGAMGNLGISFVPAFWGFMAAFSEFAGGICLILGLFFRTACSLMLFTMFVAAVMHIKSGGGFISASHAVESGIVFLSLLITGPGSRVLFKKGSCCCCK